MMDRRRFLKTAGLAAAAGLTPNFLQAFKTDWKEEEPFHWARVKFDVVEDGPCDRWNTHPWGDFNLLDSLQKMTRLNIDPAWHVAPLDKMEELQKYPFLFMTTEKIFEFNGNHQENFVEYIKRGGFIFADDCVFDCKYDYFFKDFKKKAESLFGKPMEKLPNNHDIYHCFYDFPNGLPHMQGVNHGGHALFVDGRMAVFLSPSDIHCGWCSFFGPQKTSDAIKMGINIVVYAMTR